MDFDPSSTSHAALFCASPRAGGNSENALSCFARGVAQAGGQMQTVMLRRFRIAPCLGCRRCEFDADRQCFQASRDQSLSLFQMLMSAPLLFFSSPIYYYHLPSIFKAFIDRGQCFYLRREAGDRSLIDLPQRKAYCVLVAGRATGEKLFDGSLLTLRYFLSTFNITLADPLLVRGKDGPMDLVVDESLTRAIRDYGLHAWQEAHP